MMARTLGDGDVSSEIFAELYEKNVDVARRVARRVVGIDLAEDVVQESFASVFSALTRGLGPQLEGSDEVAQDDFDKRARGYVLSTVRRTGIRWVNRSRQSIAFGDDSPELPDGGKTPPEVAELSAESAFIRDAFKSLKPRHRLVLWLVDVEELSGTQAAERLGLSVPGCASLLRRARLALSQAYLATQVSESGQNHLSPQELANYVLNREDARRAGSVEEHLETCVSCQVRLADTREAGVSLRSAAGVVAPLVIQHMGKAGSAALWGGQFGARTSLAWVASCAALAVVVGAVVWPSDDAASTDLSQPVVQGSLLGGTQTPELPWAEASAFGAENLSGEQLFSRATPTSPGAAAVPSSVVAETIEARGEHSMPATNTNSEASVTWAAGQAISGPGEDITLAFDLMVPGASSEQYQVSFTLPEGVTISQRYSDSCHVDGGRMECTNIGPFDSPSDVRGIITVNSTAAAPLPDLGVAAISS